MKNVVLQELGYRPSNEGFRKAESKSEGLRILNDTELRETIVLNYSKRSTDMLLKLIDAKHKISELYSGILGLAETPFKGLKMVARLEFRTRDRTLDNNLLNLVNAEGFDLTLRSFPVTQDGKPVYEKLERKQQNGEVVVVYEPLMDRIYTITENEYRTSDISRAVDTAERLVKLAERLRPPIKEDMRAEIPIKQEGSGVVVPITAARNSKPPTPDEPVLNNQPLDVKAS